MERVQLDQGESLLEHADPLLLDERATAHELRYLARCLRDALCDTLRVARSRGHRLGGA